MYFLLLVDFEFDFEILTYMLFITVILTERRGGICDM